MTDPETAEVTQASFENELYQGVTGVIWTTHCVTMTRSANKGVIEEDLCIQNLAQLVEMTAAGCDLDLHTSSDWLVSEWDAICQLPPEDLPQQDSSNRYYQKTILENLINNGKRFHVQKMAEGELQDYLVAARLYSEEKILLKEVVHGSHLDYDSGEAPWW
jgi:hypothetical protein